MFTIADIMDETRRLLNDSVTPYRYSNAVIEQFTKRGIGEIHSLRPDARINSRGGVYADIDLYEYTASSHMDEYGGIGGWNRRDNATIYFGAISSDTVRIYLTDADRTSDINPVAEIDRTDSYGIRHVKEANASKWNGTVLVLTGISNGTTWEVSADLKSLALDDLFMRPLINFVVSRCYDVDSEVTENAALANKYYSMFRSEVGI